MDGDVLSSGTVRPGSELGRLRIEGNYTQTPDGRVYTLADTVGFVRHLPHQLVEAFRSTLEEVVEHYNSGIQDHPNLGNALRDGSGQPVRLNLSAQEKTDLVNFLKTLTDDTIATDVRFSDPF